jgi:hypothetical protein
VSAFEVTPGELQSLAGQLSGLLGDLETAGGVVGSVDGGAAGHPDLEAAIESFAGDWRATVEAAHGKLSDLSQRLAGAGSSYEGNEQELIGVIDADQR